MNSEVVEIYVPRKLEYLSSLYEWLRNEVSEQTSKARFAGFSIYEVSGAYLGEKLYTEQTLVVRLVFDRDEGEDEGDLKSHVAKLDEISSDIARITRYQEEEIWILRVPAIKLVSRPSGS